VASYQKRRLGALRPERTDPGDPRQDVADRATRIRPTDVAVACQCHLRAILRVRGEPRLHPTPFNRELLQDGIAFEDVLLSDAWSHRLLQALNEGLGLELSRETEIRPMPSLRRSQEESVNAFVTRVASAFADAVLLGPVVLAQVTLATCLPEGSLFAGIPDLLIWTGDRWVIADIKCSEEAKLPHGLQILAYRYLLLAMCPDAVVDERGAVVHCAPGFRFARSDSEDDRHRCLTHVRATGFPMAALADVFGDYLDVLRTAASEETVAQAEQNAVFALRCTECEFRLRCYPRFLAGPHPSMVPLMSAELETIRQLDLFSVAELATACEDAAHPSHQTLLDLKDGSPLQLSFLHQQARAAAGCGGFSEWRLAAETAAIPCFYARAAGGEGIFTGASIESASCLVTYAVGEMRSAWAELRAEGRAPAQYLPEIVLSEELPGTFHFPVPSFTLRPLRDFLRAVAPGPLPELERVRAFYDGCSHLRGEDRESFAKDSLNSAERLAAVQQVWAVLLRMAELQRLEVPMAGGRA
jgi:hypothetical protein